MKEDKTEFFYKKLSNGIEYFSVCDGAGQSGHQVAEFVSRRFAELLGQADSNSLSREKLIEIAEQIQQEVLSQFSDSGTTADIILKLRNNKKFAIHVGEGNIAKIRSKEDIEASLKAFEEGKISKDELGQNILKLLFKEHRVAPQDQGAVQDDKGVWRIRNSKTKSFGVPCELTCDVQELEGGGYIIMSDGLSDLLPSLLPSLPFSSVEFVELYRGSPQKAVDYLVKKAQEYATSNHGKEADDIAAIIVNL